MKYFLALILILFSSLSFGTEKFTCLGYIATEEEQEQAYSDVIPSAPDKKLRQNKYLTKNEQVVLRTYTNNYYQQINLALRYDEKSVHYSESFTNTIKTLCSALTKLPKLQKPILYRVTDIRGTDQEDILQLYPDGKVVVEKAFLSTSMSMAGIKKFAPSLGKNHILFHIHTSEAKDISYFSLLPLEQEALIPAGLKFKVTHKGQSSKNSPYIIILEQI